MQGTLVSRQQGHSVPYSLKEALHQGQRPGLELVELLAHQLQSPHQLLIAASCSYCLQPQRKLTLCSKSEKERGEW